jgi:hypothetical protein
MSSRLRFALSGAILAAALVAPPVFAQSGGDGFLFKRPVGSLAIRAGYGHANAGSDIFSTTINELTVDRRDFSGLALGADLSFRIASRVDGALGIGYDGTSTPSEYRHFVDQDNQPIQQTTSFRRIPITASVKVYLTPRGREIGHFAWVPARLTPYIGGGGGMMWYRFRQQGDFIDNQTMAVFGDDLESSGWTPEAHALAGFEYSLSPRFALIGEGRYAWARADLDKNYFAGFQRIDLSGFSATAGIAVRF